MIVKELMKKLEGFPPEMEVKLSTTTDGIGYWDSDIDNVCQPCGHGFVVIEGE